MSAFIDCIKKKIDDGLVAEGFLDEIDENYKRNLENMVDSIEAQNAKVEKIKGKIEDIQRESGDTERAGLELSEVEKARMKEVAAIEALKERAYRARHKAISLERIIEAVLLL